MELDSELSKQDFHRYYMGTFVKVGKQVVNIMEWKDEEVDHDSDEDSDAPSTNTYTVRLVGYPDMAPTQTNWKRLLGVMETPWPVRGYFQQDKLVYWNSRRMLRQYHRAICRDSWVLQVGGNPALWPASPRPTCSLVYNALYPQFVELEEGIGCLEKGSLYMAALSSELMMTPSSPGKDAFQILWMNNCPVAKVIRADKKVLVGAYEIHGQEISDYFKRKGLDQWQVLSI